MEKISISGTGQNSKSGAIVITKNNEVYYLEGINSWNNEDLDKEIIVEGELKISNINQEDLQNSKGEYSQGNSGEIKTILNPKWNFIIKTAENDSILIKLKSKLPENWFVEIQNNNLIISNKITAYLIFENKINAPINNETIQEKEIRFKKYGKQINPEFVFVLKEKLNETDLAKIKLKNQKIKKSISEQYSSLKDIPVSRKDGSFLPKNDKDRERINKFEQEKIKLESQLLQLPDYQTEKYSLFLLNETGIETEYISIFPESVSQEMYIIKNEILEKIFIPIEK
jgi:hypothetical protein